MNYIAQILGFIALIFIVLSYQNTKKERFLLIQIFANIFFGLQYLTLKAFSAFCSSVISLIRTIIFFKYEKKNNKVPIIILIIILLIITIFGIITYEGIYSLIPIIIALAYTYGTWQEKLKLTYTIGIIASILWIYYNFLVGAYISIIGSIFELFASLIGLIKVLKKIKKEGEIKNDVCNR